LFAVVAVRLVDVQALERDRYLALGRDQRVRTISIPAVRGSIFDRTGADLAISVERETIWANPQQIAHPAEVAAQLAPIDGLDELTLRGRLAQTYREFVYVAR
jgi:cell division protein FtsI (penicillin-binding protein 3)